MDSAATKHSNDELSLFDEYSATPATPVMMADVSESMYIGSGQVNLHTGSDILQLNDVKYAPQFAAKLLSVSQLASEGHEVHFNAKEAVVTKDGKEILKADRVNNLYSFTESDFALSAKQVEDFHTKLGHPGASKMAVMKKLYPDLAMVHPDRCETCLRTKIKQLPYRSSDSRASEPLELIHTDLCGPFRITGHDGSRY